MSAIRKMSTVCICAYRIGVASARRDEWMGLARRWRTDGNTVGVQHCVRIARQRNRELLESLRTLREMGALQVQP